MPVETAALLCQLSVLPCHAIYAPSQPNAHLLDAHGVQTSRVGFHLQPWCLAATLGELNAFRTAQFM